MLMLRLRHALVIANVQGQTFTDRHVTILDLEHPYMTMRHLIVAGSRVTHGKYLHTMRPSEQRTFLYNCSYEALQQDVNEACLPTIVKGIPVVAIPNDEPWAFGDEW
jgi:hypothetical protein